MSTNLTKAVIITSLLILIFGGVIGAAAEEDKNGKNRETLYTVHEGDNLSIIAEKASVSLRSLIKANRLSSTVIYPKQVLIIPGQKPDYDLALSRGFSREDTLLLAKAIYAEARGESFTGQVAVGAVIINRLESRDFPNTVREIVMQNKRGVYQFSPVKDGSINLQPDELSIYAAIQAIAGHDPTNGALYFYNPKTATDQWIKTLPVISRIGNHVFASKT